MKKVSSLKLKSWIFTQQNHLGTEMHNFKSINVNHLQEYMLQTDLTKLIKLLDVTTLTECESSVYYCFINKSDITSSQEAFYILLTRLIISWEGWDDYYRNHEPPVFIDNQYLNKIINDYLYIKDNLIQFDILSTNKKAEEFASSLYYINLDQNLTFINDIMNKFPLISLLQLVDFPNNFMEDLSYFMETEFHYIYVSSSCSG